MRVPSRFTKPATETPTALAAKTLAAILSKKTPAPFARSVGMLRDSSTSPAADTSAIFVLVPPMSIPRAWRESGFTLGHLRQVAEFAGTETARLRQAHGGELRRDDLDHRHKTLWHIIYSDQLNLAA